MHEKKSGRWYKKPGTIVVVACLTVVLGTISTFELILPLYSPNSVAQTGAKPEQNDAGYEQETDTNGDSPADGKWTSAPPPPDDNTAPEGGRALQKWLLQVRDFDTAMEYYSLAPECSPAKNAMLGRALELAKTSEEFNDVYTIAPGCSEIEAIAKERMEKTRLEEIANTTGIDALNRIYTQSPNGSPAEKAAKERRAQLAMELIENTTDYHKIVYALRFLPEGSPEREDAEEKLAALAPKEIENVRNYSEAYDLYYDLPRGSPERTAALWKMLEMSQTAREACTVHARADDPELEQAAKEKCIALTFQEAQNAITPDDFWSIYHNSPDEIQPDMFHLMLDRYCKER